MEGDGMIGNGHTGETKNAACMYACMCMCCFQTSETGQCDAGYLTRHKGQSK
jgi:hypothetical protein